ncbi:SubName: Full=Uncharacterized protein {ECO:0000313/EMBL:CCA75503.1} [Serendipita indica DSM 11827]|uniref:BTB domain-containing protein n=1 Tax=Serendipita indica (strain DSM 11827) TaxID=1109443 RepID=G4TW10_SERID|nr:SubName: Full=Uncharacterized protein {ECO:0000313/EMBL:CCA75503.1} [Serendipita indica DSM 11827]CCA75503.1 hypothetical protein PIIN_09486 [Serendipita indica DSM 11827]
MASPFPNESEQILASSKGELDPRRPAKDSKTFPRGSGDLELVSTDNFRFGIHKFLLHHACGFFADMFSLPTPQKEELQDAQVSEKSQKIIEINLPAKILHEFLSHIEPNEPQPNVDPATVGPLIDAALFYRVPCIISWFISGISSDCANRDTQKLRPSLLATNPLLTLALCYKVGSESGVKSAIRELITCKIDLWYEDVDIGGRLLLYCLQLRQQRTALYLDLTDHMADFEFSNTGNAKDKTRPTCMSCSITMGRWINSLASASSQWPKWENIGAIFNSPVNCHSCELTWSDYKSKAFTKWVNVNRPDRKEQHSPVIPEWLTRNLGINAGLVPLTRKHRGAF